MKGLLLQHFQVEIEDELKKDDQNEGWDIISFEIYLIHYYFWFGSRLENSYR